jgi:hypothetical protein
MTLSMFVPITKVDAVQRLVYGTLASEAVDKTGEVFDYETSKPHVEEWSGECAKATDGKSVGNLRAMHGKVAAGKFTSLECNDQTKSIEVCAKVVDNDEWEKVAEGVYTGFSIGGSYVKKWTDEDGNKRYTAKPSEGSLVDNPANPDAHFSMIKADGVEELRKFSAPAPETPELEQVWKAKDGQTFATKALAKAHNEELAKPIDPAKSLETALAGVTAAVEKVEKRDFSQDERDKAADAGQAMPDGSYPIKSVQDLKNAIQAFGRAKNKKAVKAHIKARAKALGAESELPDSWKDGEAGKAALAGELRKGLDCVSRLAILIQELEWLQQYTEREAEVDGDESTIPAELKEDIANLCATLRNLVEEETNELLDEDEAVEYGELLEMSARATMHKVMGDKAAKVLAKAGARHGKADAMHLNAAHDHIKKAMGENGEECDKMFPGAEKSAADNKLAHMAHAHNMTKAAGAECPGGESKCAMYEAAKAAGGKEDDTETSAADHLHAAHDHLTKMGIPCGKEAAEKLAKAGARHSAADMESLTHAHDALKMAGAACPGGESKCMKDVEPDGFPTASPDQKAGKGEEKEAAAPAGDLAKLLEDERAKTTKLEKLVGDVASAITDLTKRVERFESMPVPHPKDRAPPNVRVIEKGDDAENQIAQELEKLSPEERTAFFVKLARSQGRPIVR